MPDKLLIVRTFRPALSEAFPDFYICTIGATFAQTVTYGHVVVACELFTDAEWRWYHTTVKRICRASGGPVWTS